MDPSPLRLRTRCHAATSGQLSTGVSLLCSGDDPAETGLPVSPTTVDGPGAVHSVSTQKIMAKDERGQRGSRARILTDTVEIKCETALLCNPELACPVGVPFRTEIRNMLDGRRLQGS